MPADAPSAPASHDSFLELLRNVSVLRVVLLHLVLRPPLLYLPWIQWLYPGMPEIFFVSGWLAATSIARRGARHVVASRVRRVLLPYSVYAVVAISAMAITDVRSSVPSARLRPWNLLTFIVPLTEPTGSTSRAILWSHLWFVTVFLWLILATALLLRLITRVGWGVLVLPLGLVAIAVGGRQWAHVNVPSEIGLIGQFGTYYTLGLLASQRSIGSFNVGLKTAPRKWFVVCGLCAAGGVLVATVIEPIRRKHPAELYSSRTAYLLIGLAWLALALAFHGPLSAWTARRPSRFLQLCTQRTFTLYLWGLPADSIGVAVAKHVSRDQWVSVPVYVVVSLCALTTAVLALGWVEDVSARRTPRLVPTS